MKKVLFKILLLLILSVLLISTYSYGKYCYSFNFEALSLSMQEVLEPPFTGYTAASQVRSFVLIFRGLSTDVYKIEGTLYNKDYLNDVQVKYLVRYSTTESLSFNYSDFNNGLNYGTFVYSAKFYDRRNNLLYELHGEKERTQ